MLFVFCVYTVLIVFLNITSDVSTNLIEPQDVPSLTPQDIRDRVWGSKCVLVVESMMCCVQWGTKVCLLALYWRLTENLRQRRLVQIAAGYGLVTFIVMMSLYYGYWCRPFRAFWETPTPNIQCATQTHHLTVNLVFNLTSDLLIIFIPLPMFIKAHLELKKKLLLIFPFSLGFFTMVCAILSKWSSFTQPYSPEWIYWYTREASTAMIVSNMPYSWAIVRKVFNLKGFLNRSGSHSDPDELDTRRHISGISIPHTSTARPSAADSLGKSRLSKLSIFHSSKSEPQKNHSTSESIKPFAATENSFNMMDWKSDESESSPSSSASTEEQCSAKQQNRKTYLTDIDRLYKLDDEDLEADAPRQHNGRGYEP